MTHLCVSIFVHDINQARRDIAAAAEAGADMVELRLDKIAVAKPDYEKFEDSEAFHTELAQYLRVYDHLRELIDAFDIRVVITCRPTWEGGNSTIDDAGRSELLTKLQPGDDWTYIDLELETLRRLAAKESPVSNPLILSTHDFRGRPERLYNLIAELNASPSAVNKIVWTARTIRDNLEAFELLQTRQKPTIALCMGEAGIISRILAKKFGAFLTFASLGEGAGTAPGQVSIHDLKRLYRWDSIKPSTKVYGVVAKPVMHSMSPAIHNAAFDQTGHDGVYLPLLVEDSYESFKAFMESFLHTPGLDLAGLSITIPHKGNALRYLKEKGAEVEELAERIGAVNTITVASGESRVASQERSRATRNSQLATLQGINTDYAAILDSITDALDITREDLAGYRVAVLGAGGTGRAAVAALAHCGATVVVYNRTRERADALAEEFNGRRGKVVAARLEKLCDSCCHIYINTTSVGMHPNVDQSPLGDAPPKFTADTLVFDTVYNPMKTRLLRQAEAAGAKTMGGIEMFVRQAAAQFEAWTGQPAPREVMRRVVEERLADSE